MMQVVPGGRSRFSFCPRFATRHACVAFIFGHVVGLQHTKRDKLHFLICILTKAVTDLHRQISDTPSAPFSSFLCSFQDILTENLELPSPPQEILDPPLEKIKFADTQTKHFQFRRRSMSLLPIKTESVKIG